MHWQGRTGLSHDHIFFQKRLFSKPDYTNEIRAKLLHKGLVTWECGKDANVIGLVPPICISKASLNKSLKIILDTFSEIK